MSDGRTPFNVTLGTGLHTRNAPALVNSSSYVWSNWSGRFAAQWELPLAVAENALTMNSTRLKLAHFIYESDKPDTGRLAGLTNPMTDDTARSAFRTASLREVKDTAPYMHAGQLADLAAVVSFYNAGGGELPSTAPAGTVKDPLLAPLGLSDTEQADLVEFLKTLSGDPAPSSLLAPP
jgi:cytochrome c peroxidase